MECKLLYLRKAKYLGRYQKLMSCSFLLATLHMTSVIAIATTPLKARKAIKQLPQGEAALGERYLEAMERIESQHAGRRELAKKTFLWLSYSCRPLQVDELLHALAIDILDIDFEYQEESDHEESAVEFDEDNIPDIALVLSSCAGLVLISSSSHVVGFAHYTVQEFFIGFRDKWYPDGHSLLCVACIQYLSHEGLCSRSNQNEEAYALKHYAANFWGEHAKRGWPANYQKAVLGLLNSDRQRFKAASWRGSEEDFSLSHRPQREPQVVKAAHLVAYFGLNDMIEPLDFSENAADSETSPGHTALAWAVHRGYIGCVKKLLDRGASIPVPIPSSGEPFDFKENRFVHNPLTLAFRRQEILDYMLDHDAFRRIPTDDCKTMLILAAFFGKKDVVSRLLTPSHLEWARNPGVLAIATYSKNIELVQWLLELGADVQDETSWATSLDYACQSGSKDMVSYLLSRGAKIPMERGRLTRTLHDAACGGITFFLGYLIEAGADVDAIGHLRKATALDAAVIRQRWDVTRLLLDAGASPSSSGVPLNDGPLHFLKADQSGAGSALRELEVLMTNRSTPIGSPVQVAALMGNADIVRLMLQKGVTPNASAGLLGHVLQVASRIGNTEVTSVLLEHGSDVHASAGPFGNAFEAARRQKHESIERILLNWEANPDLRLKGSPKSFNA